MTSLRGGTTKQTICIDDIWIASFISTGSMHRLAMTMRQNRINIAKESLAGLSARQFDIRLFHPNNKNLFLTGCKSITQDKYCILINPIMIHIFN